MAEAQSKSLSFHCYAKMFFFTLMRHFSIDAGVKNADNISKGSPVSQLLPRLSSPSLKEV